MEEQVRIKTTEINTQIRIEEIQHDQRETQQQRVTTDRNSRQDPEGQPGDFLTQFQQAAEALQNDTSRSSDSFEMRAVKQEVQKLQQMLQNSDPCELFLQYSWMETVLREKYLKPRLDERSSYRARHQKVQRILELVSNEKRRIQETGSLSKADILKAEHRNMSTLSDQICRSNREAANNRAALQNLLVNDVPMQEQKFNGEKEKILAAYDALIGSFQSVAKSFCITQRAKQNRLDAERVVLQLKQEKKLYQDATFESLAKHHYRAWGEELIYAVEKPVLPLDREQLTERKDLFVSTDEAGIKADEATQMFFRMVGASKLCAGTEKAHFTEEDGAEKNGLVIRKGAHFYTHAEALEYSRQTGKNLVYSPEALQQLGTIQIIDMICGQKNRQPDSFVYKLKEQEIDEESYLTIESLKVTDNTLSFGKETFEELNRDSEEGEEICTKQLVLNHGILSVADYDFRVADTILSLDPTLMHTYFLAAGLERGKADALSTRLQKVQKALEKDKECGTRAQTNQIRTQRERETIQQNSAYESTHFNGVRELVRDRSMVKEGPMKDINDTAMNERIHSNALSIQKSNQIKEAVTNDLRDKFGLQELNKDTEQILTLIDQYAKANKNKEWYGAKWTMKVINFAKLTNPKLVNDLLKQAQKDEVPEAQLTAEIKRRLVEKYENYDEIVNQAEEAPLEELRPKLEDRIRTLAGREGALTDPERTELERLRFYQTVLFGQCDGTLEIPANANVKYVSDQTGFERGLRWRKKDQTPLFCHEPCISDLNQSEVADCYFVATLAALVDREPDLIKQNMKDNGDGTVTVRFFKSTLFGGTQPVYVKVDKTIPGGAESYKSGLCGAMWAKLYEKAFIASNLKLSKWFGRYSPKDIEGGQTQDAVFFLTGRKAKQLFYVNSKTSYKKYRDPGSRAARRFKEHVKNVRALLQQATDRHQIMMGGTYREFQTESEETVRGEHKFRGLLSQHAYTILGLVQIDGKDFVKLRNPGGKDAIDLMVNETTNHITYRAAGERTGAFYLDLNTFCRFFSQVYAADSQAS